MECFRHFFGCSGCQEPHSPHFQVWRELRLSLSSAGISVPMLSCYTFNSPIDLPFISSKQSVDGSHEK